VSYQSSYTIYRNEENVKSFPPAAGSTDYRQRVAAAADLLACADTLTWA
jgi:hypothetical protein